MKFVSKIFLFLLFIFSANIFALNLNENSITGKTASALNYAFKNLGISRRSLGFEKAWYKDEFRLPIQEKCLADPVFPIEMSDKLISNIDNLSPLQIISEITSVPYSEKNSTNSIENLIQIREKLFVFFQKYQNKKLYNYLIFNFSNVKEKRNEFDNLINAGANKQIINNLINQADNYLLQEENINQYIFTELSNFSVSQCISYVYEVINNANKITFDDKFIKLKDDFIKKGIQIGSYGRDVYTNKNTWLIIDPGGDDIYDNLSGFASIEINQPLKIIIDFDGDDVYKNDFSFGAACGIFGISVLIDKNGNDSYKNGSMAQGAGLGGVGILMDSNGDDFYSADNYSQGAGFFGLGALIDNNGNDNFNVSSYGQAIGFTKGYGFLIDNNGNDIYYAGGVYPDIGRYDNNYISMSQGIGIGKRPFASGGIGTLIDKNGNDTYIADVFGQGSAYWFGLGMLIDKRGQDTYNLYEYGQGAGIHMGCGILADGEGNDVYTLKGGIGQGAEHDFSVGLLRDYSGNDKYNGNITVQGGAINNGVSFLIDDKGNDWYSSWSNISHGDGEWAERRDFGSIGFLLDLSGKDKYGIKETNNFKKINGLIGICVDFPTNFIYTNKINLINKKLAINKFENCYPYSLKYKSPKIENVNFERLYRMAIESSYSKEKNILSEKAVNKLKQLGPKIIPLLAKKIEHPCNQSSYAIQNIIMSWKTNAIPMLLEAYNSTTNQRVKRVLIYFMGLNRDNRIEPAAVKELNDNKNRSIALWALGNCGVTQSIEYAEKYLFEGETEMTRVRSAGILRKVGSTNETAMLVDILKLPDDNMWNLKCAAVKALEKQSNTVISVIKEEWEELPEDSKALINSVFKVN